MRVNESLKRNLAILAASICLLWFNAGPVEGGVTSLILESEPGEYVGAGRNYFFQASDGTFTVGPAFTGNAVEVNFREQAPGMERWTLTFAARNNARLAVGIYTGATRWPFQSFTEPGLDVSGNNRGCNTITGDFEVHEITYDGDVVTSLRVSFEQHCEGLAPALRGEIRYNAASAVGLTVPGPFEVVDGALLSFDISATAGTGAVTFSGQNLPAGVSITPTGAGMATVKWTPGARQLGQFSLALTATDAGGESGSAFVLVTVTPSHDEVESARALTALLPVGRFDGGFEGATVQPGESDNSSNRSVWFTFVAATPERLVLELENDLGPVTLRVYRKVDPNQPASLANLERLTRGHVDDDPSHDRRRFVLGPVPGTPYYVSVEGQSTESTYALTWRRAELARVLWRNTNGAASLWRIDGAGAIVTSAVYGPYAGWEVQRVLPDKDGGARLLWRHASGAINIWNLDAAGSLVSHFQYGPFQGWSVVDFILDQGFDLLNVSWKHETGALSIWRMAEDASSLWSSQVFGPYSGWSPTGYGLDSAGNRRFIWLHDSGAAGLWLMPFWEATPTMVSAIGPYAGWIPHDVAAGSPDTSARILWRHSTGAIGLWHVLADGALATATFGPYAGWQAVGVAVPALSPDYGDTATRILWRHSDGSAAIWSTSMTGELSRSFAYGPFAGWTVIEIAVGPE